MWKPGQSGNPAGRKPKQYDVQLVKQVSELYSSGRTQTEIAVVLGTTQKVVYKLMRRHGIKARPAIKRHQTGSDNSTWKGSRAGYKAFHLRVSNQRGRPKKCEICGTHDPSKRYEWANLTGKYDDPDDYKRMCKSCHARHDKAVSNLRRKRNLR